MEELCREHCESVLSNQPGKLSDWEIGREVGSPASAHEAISLIHKISTCNIPDGDFETILNSILEAAMIISGAQKGALQLIQPGTDELEIAVQIGFSQAFIDFSHSAARGSHTISGIALARKERVIAEDITKSPILHGTPELDILTDAGVQAVQCTPLVNRSGVITGMLSTYWSKPRHPDEYELKYIDLLSRLASDTISKKRMDEALWNSEERLKFLLYLSDMLRTLSAPDEIQAAVTRSVRERFAADSCCYCESEDECPNSGQSSFCNALPQESEKFLFCDFSIFKAFSAIFDAGRPVIVTDATKLVDEKLRELLIRKEVISLLGVPVLNDGRAVGILCITQRSPRKWTDGEVELAVEISRRTREALLRAKAEEALRKGESILRTILENSRDGINMLDLKTRKYVYMNPAHVELTGFTADEMNDLFEGSMRVHPEDIKNAAKQRRMAEKGLKESVDVEYRWKVKSGEYRWFSERSQLVRNSQGEPAYLVRIYRDITERKATVEALKESEARFRSVLERARDVIYRLNLQTGLFEYVSPSIETVLGYTPAEFAFIFAKSPSDLVHPDDLLAVRAALAEANERGHSEAVYRQRTKKGDYRWLSNYYSVVYDAEGRPLYRDGNIRDVTKLKEAEKALRERGKRQAFLLRLSDALNILSDENLIMDTTTKLLVKHLKVTQSNFIHFDEDEAVVQSEARNDGALNMRGAQKREELSAAYDILRSGRDVVYSDVLEYREFPEELRKKWFSQNIRASITVPIFREGRLVASLSVRQTSPRLWSPEEVDLVHETAERAWLAIERARAEEALRASEQRALALISELEKADENKNRFISVLSHELRNPLAVIVASLSLLEISNDPEQTATAMSIVRRQVSQLRKLVDDLLDLTRISQNKYKLKKEYVNLNDILASLARDIESEFMAKGVRLCIELPEEPVYLEADPVRIAQCVGNLLWNALKYTPSGGLVTLSQKTENSEALISVRDNGMGMSPEFLAHIFSPFTQADTSLDRANSGGLGLGLSIADGIARLHGGSITAFSEGLGKGSVFTVRLPIAEMASSPQNTLTAEKAGHAFRILIVEDNRDLVEVLRSMLSLLGHQVFTAFDGEEGISEAKRILPEVIICDIGLPKVSGYEMARILKADPQLKGAFLVALSGYAGECDIEKALKSGFDRHVAKPVDMAVIKKMLSEISY